MFHLSRWAAERTIFKGLIASGWHTAAMTMRLFVQTLNFAEGAIGLGVDKLRWPNAVRPGDVLTVETKILDSRLSRSRPRYGIIRLRNVTTNERGEVVQTMLANALVRRRLRRRGLTTDHKRTGRALREPKRREHISRSKRTPRKTRH
jgi:acyl dehydratase